MYIGHVSDCYLPRLGGIEWQVHDLATRQGAAGHRVEVVTTVPGPLRHGDITVHRPRGRAGAERIRYRAARRGGEWATLRGFDVLHVHTSTFSPLAFYAIRAAARAEIPTVVTLHSMWARYATALFGLGHRSTNWGAWPVQWTAVSTAAAAPLRRVLPAGTPIGVLPNGVDHDLWRPRRAEGVQPRQGSDLHVVSTLRFAHRKRPLPLVDMLARAQGLLGEGVRLRATLVGDGPLLPATRTAVACAGLADRVNLPGRLDRAAIADLYAGADVYLAPGELESFGIAALEARCAGLPVLGRSGTGLTDFITPGVDGLLGASDDELVAHLVALAGDAELRGAIAEHNSTQPPRVSWPQILRSCDRLYAAAGADDRPEAGPPDPRPVPGHHGELADLTAGAELAAAGQPPVPALAAVGAP